MIITRLLGGLGNQMFEYAMGLGIAREKSTNYKMNLRAFKETRIPYGLNHFNISSKVANRLEILLVKKLSPKNYLDESYWLNYENWVDWMGDKKFRDIEDTIKQEFTLKKEHWDELEKNNGSIIKEMNEYNSVSVHIRRTDYFDKENCIVLGQKYYEEAMGFLKKTINNPKYFFFSDDMEWAKKTFSHLPDSHFLSNRDYEDIVLMSLCKHNIIANSTFSWWSAWLNKNPNKIVITPSKWFVKSYNVESSLNIKGWTVIPDYNSKIQNG